MNKQAHIKPTLSKLVGPVATSIDSRTGGRMGPSGPLFGLGAGFGGVVACGNASVTLADKGMTPIPTEIAESSACVASGWSGLVRAGHDTVTSVKRLPLVVS